MSPMRWGGFFSQITITSEPILQRKVALQMANKTNLFLMVLNRTFYPIDSENTNNLSNTNTKKCPKPPLKELPIVHKNDTNVTQISL